MENKTLTLTPDEVEMVRDEIEFRLSDQDAYLCGHADEIPEGLNKEQAIKQVRTAESILKKLG